MSAKIWAGILVVVLGSLVFLSALLNWEKMFTGKRTFLSIAWFSERFGRKNARVIAGILGILVILYGLFYIKMS